MTNKRLIIGAQILAMTLAVPAFAATSPTMNTWERQYDKTAAIDYRQQFDEALRFHANAPRLATAIATHDNGERLFMKGDYKDAMTQFAMAVKDLDLTPTMSGVDHGD